MGERACAVDGCGRRHFGRGWCKGHYFRWYKTGEPGQPEFRPRPIPMDPTATEKRCRTCGVARELGSFSPTGRNGALKGECKQCAAERERLRRFSSPDKMRDADLRKNFGLTLKQYEEMVAAQCGLCAVCGRAEFTKHQNGNVKRLAVHHDHATGRVVALLCSPCNRGMGLMSDDPTERTWCERWWRPRLDWEAAPP